MDELPDIDQWLVTPENPPRDVDGMDHERCAALHNYLIQYAWVASNENLVGSFEPLSWFEKHGDRANEVREYLDPSVVMFLESVHDAIDDFRVKFFYWVSGLNDPGDLWSNWEPFSEGGEEYRRMTLYNTNCGLLGSHTNGLCYDQKLHKAYMFISLDDHESADKEEHEHLWHPLETVLSNWILTLRMGKITAGPDGVRLDNEKFDPWMYHSYSPQQVEDTVAAFNRLVVAIESRIPPSQRKWPTSTPILSHKLLDAAFVPNPSFARSFLTTIRLPSFQYIAPGLLLPTPETFVQNQLFTPVKDENDNLSIPPVLLFSAKETVSLKYGPYDHKPLGLVRTDALQGKPILAGVYTEAVSRRAEDTAEEGFRLILPYSIGQNGYARESTGSIIDSTVRPSFQDLYQHGFKPFGGDWSRAQRLVRLLDNWTGMVERGLWEVGEDGVLGGIEKFKEADTKERWKDYWMEPDW
ncbi:hypothetical protein EG329_001369 [Mollisiaceae sp. DMI_Dod_QoI]|nr:hypothetical protein EG329_001369 [Helotiales sp. DMI_Dod_QoI]